MYAPRTNFVVSLQGTIERDCVVGQTTTWVRSDNKTLCKIARTVMAACWLLTPKHKERPRFISSLGCLFWKINRYDDPVKKETERRQGQTRAGQLRGSQRPGSSERTRVCLHRAPQQLLSGDSKWLDPNRHLNLSLTSVKFRHFLLIVLKWFQVFARLRLFVEYSVCAQLHH